MVSFNKFCVAHSFFLGVVSPLALKIIHFIKGDFFWQLFKFILLVFFFQFLKSFI